MNPQDITDLLAAIKYLVLLYSAFGGFIAVLFIYCLRGFYYSVIYPFLLTKKNQIHE